jgi:hypothetical protein
MPRMAKKMHNAGIKAVKTKRINDAWERAHAAERASKKALRKYCEAHGWRVAFFEVKTGAPRTGIIDAIAYRLGKQNPDEMILRLIQLKGGKAAITGEEIGRLKEAANALRVKYLIAELGAKTGSLQLIPDDLDTD